MRLRRRREKGASLVEVGLIVPMLILLSIGLSEVGFLVVDYITVTNAARCGARTGAAAADDPNADQFILNVVEEAVCNLRFSNVESVAIYKAGVTGAIPDPLNNDERYWKHTSVKGANEIPVIVDCAHWHFRARHTDVLPTKPLITYKDFPENGVGGTDTWRVFLDRHSGAIQGCFLDGSAGRIPLWTLWDLKWHRKFVKQNLTKEHFPFLQ